MTKAQIEREMKALQRPRRFPTTRRDGRLRYLMMKCRGWHGPKWRERP